MEHILTRTNSIANRYLSELRDVHVQKDRFRFRHNLERLGEIMAYEISKTLNYTPYDVQTPLGVAATKQSFQRIVAASIMRAGLPLQQGVMRVFDQADAAFVSAYRKHHRDGSFDISMDYVTCPNLDGTVLILCDPMLATGASMHQTLEALAEYGTPSVIHIVTVIGSQQGLDYIKRKHPKCQIWMGDLDEELTAKAYIVPGLGDAGDLSFGSKLQE